MIDVKKMKKELLKTDPTLYCSAMAHLRGKLHMTKLNGGTVYEVTGQDCWSFFGYDNKECVADSRRHMFHWTKKDQEELVLHIIEKYTVEESIGQVQTVPVENAVAA